MPVNNGEIVKSWMEFNLADGTIAQMVYHWKVYSAGEVTSADVIAAVEQYMEDIVAAVQAYIDADITLNPTPVQIVDWDATEDAWVIDRNIGTATCTESFSSTVDPLPNQCAPVMVANTARPKSRGRKFFPGFDDNSASGSDMAAAVLTALGTALAHYLADETISGADVLSPGVIRAGVNAFLDFTTGQVNSVIGTQRRRKPGVGA